MTSSEWNAAHAVGTAVRYWPVKGWPESRDTRTRSEAWTLGSGHAIVLVDGITGGVHIDHLKVLP